MALKYKIDKSAYETLAADIKKEYTADGDSFVLDITGAFVSDRDVGPLARAHDRGKARIKDLETQLGAVEGELEVYKNDPKTRDIKTLEKSWEDKLKKREGELEGENGKLKSFLNESMVNGVAIAIASEITTAPDLMLPHILKRLTVDLTGDKPATKVLDNNGQPSALSIDDLKNELLTNKSFAPIIVASRAKGAGSGPPAHTKASGKAADTPINPMKLNPAEMAARIAARKGK